MADYYESLLKSFDVVAQSTMENLNYNKTILCTVIEAKEESSYLVSDTNTTFLAYASADGEYGEGDVVYVLVPNNEQEEKKWITGKYASDEDGYEDFDPEGLFNEIKYSEYMDKKVELKANGSQKEILVSDVSENIEENFICLAGDFSVNIPGAVDGNYGLRLTIKKDSGDTVYLLDKMIMTGNVYNQTHTQGILLNIIDDKIKGYTIEAFQEGDFVCSDGKKYSYKGLNNKEYTNIKITNIRLLAGESSEILNEFTEKHYSQLIDNSGIVIGNKNGTSGIYLYSNKNLIGSFGENGKIVVGDNLAITGEKIQIKGKTHFDLVNMDGESILKTTQEGLEFNNVVFDENTIKNSKETLESVLFEAYSKIRQEEKGTAVSLGEAQYYISNTGNDENSGLTEQKSFKTFKPIRKLINNGLKSFTITFLATGNYDLSYLNRINSIDIKFVSNYPIKLTSSEELVFFNTSLKFGENFIFVPSNNKIINYLGSFQFEGSSIYRTIQLNGASLKAKDTKIPNIIADGSALDFENVYIEKLDLKNSDCLLINCQIKGKGNQAINGYNSSIIIRGANTKILTPQSRAQTLIKLSGGKISLLDAPESPKALCTRFLDCCGAMMIADEEILKSWKALGTSNEIEYSYASVNGAKEKGEK